jgi:hypothetical protein
MDKLQDAIVKFCKYLNFYSEEYLVDLEEKITDPDRKHLRDWLNELNKDNNNYNIEFYYCPLEKNNHNSSWIKYTVEELEEYYFDYCVLYDEFYDEQKEFYSHKLVNNTPNFRRLTPRNMFKYDLNVMWRFILTVPNVIEEEGNGSIKEGINKMIEIIMDELSSYIPAHGSIQNYVQNLEERYHTEMRFKPYMKFKYSIDGYKWYTYDITEFDYIINPRIENELL